MKSAADLIAEAKDHIAEITPAELRALRATHGDVVVIDVREDREWRLGRIPGADHMSRGTLEGKIETAVPRNRKVVVYCASGNRSALAAATLREMGYTDVSSLSGGFKDWVMSEGDVES
ncbi:MAG: hypothetical protein NVS1B4_03000 [Gemmatimonadaceae bacterium]